MWNTVTRSQFCPVEDHGQQGQVRPRRGPESPNPGEAQVGTTVTRSRVVSGADQNHQVQVWCRWQPNSTGPGKALVGTRVTRYMRSYKHMGSLGGAAVWRLPLAQGAIWRPGIESHVGLPVHGTCFSLCLCLCLSLSL